MSPRDHVTEYKVSAKIADVLRSPAKMINDVANMIVDIHENELHVDGDRTVRLGVITIVIGLLDGRDSVSPVGSAMLFSGIMPPELARLILTQNAEQIDSAIKLGPDGVPLS
jgi:hypothetical protein